MAGLGNAVLTMKDEFKFGKHKGQKVETIVEADPQYIIWFDENVAHIDFDKEVMMLAKSNAREDTMRRSRPSNSPFFPDNPYDCESDDEIGF